MECHIQLPRFWMKNFRNDIKDGVQVYCFNLSNEALTDGKTTIPPNSIGSINTRHLGTITDYYIQDFEHYLDKNWETTFGEIVTNIQQQIRSGLKKLEISSNDVDFIRRFIAVSVGRSVFSKEWILKNDTSPLRFIGINEITPLSIIQENLKLFENYEIQFLYNKTDVGFILPSYSYYYVEIKSGSTPIIPISSKIAIRFIKNIDPLFSKVVIELTDEENIKNYNYYAGITEMATNRQFLISSNRKELEILYNGD